jgi:hypothetical protein
LAEGGAEQEVADQVYASLLDRFVECCAPERWEQWASRAIYLEPIWESDLVGTIRDFEIAVLSAVWPGIHLELERSLLTLARVLHEARETFLEHAQLKENEFHGGKFYKELRESNPKRYNELFSQWRAWQTKSQALVFEATRAVNWVADCTRETINPAFFAIRGKFRLIPSFFSDIPGDLWVPEYSTEERANLPDSLQERFALYRKLFPFPLSDDD